MRTAQMRAAAAIPLVAGCWRAAAAKGEARRPRGQDRQRGDRNRHEDESRDVRRPASDPTLKQLDALPRDGGYPGSTSTASPRTTPRARRRSASRRHLRHGRRRDHARARASRHVRVRCPQYEWPPRGARRRQATYDAARQDGLRDRRPSRTASRPGQRTSTTWSPTATFGERGIRTMNVFGPARRSVRSSGGGRGGRIDRRGPASAYGCVVESVNVSVLLYAAAPQRLGGADRCLNEIVTASLAISFG